MKADTLAVPSKVKLIEFEDEVEYSIPKHKQRLSVYKTAVSNSK
jgi:hypothetical protein